MHLCSSFSANTLLGQYVHNVLHFFSKCTGSRVFFCTVLQLLALVFCFGDQVLSPGSSLATDFFWSGSIVASGTEKIFPALLASLAGPVRPLTSCFKLFLLFSSSSPSCLSLPTEECLGKVPQRGQVCCPQKARRLRVRSCSFLIFLQK